MYAYTFIRKDLPIAQQLVQVGHSAMEAGSELKPAGLIPNLVLCETADEASLRQIEQHLVKHNIRYHMFYEPDNDHGYTSITTEPLTVERKRPLGHFRLWKGV